ncbi:hypothetical protein [Devosia lacusdianchii]|uniref:hypothetical protein n=1 Tax=Devosia lacusdianchii TaxID=2917991 RepID=UPI001F0546DA|nr:hypothetical protein [Devosia sp. JXJ CY 41]
MTGYNHYPDCPCGWCVNDGRTRIDRAQLSASYRVHEAKTFLSRNGARSIAGCYVNPNANCPVCGAAVFFYANASGSKVYFDDLGPPWQKHPCTDNPRRTIREHPAFAGGPVRRAAGITQELVEAARTAGAFHASAGVGRWHLLVVVAVERRGKSIRLLTEHLASDDAQRVWISCISDEPLFEVGDFLSRQGNRFSFLYKEAMSPAGFMSGGPVTVEAVEKQAMQAPAPHIPRLKLAPASRLPIKPARTYDMTKKEMAHFHARHRTVQQLCDDLLPTVRSYAKDGFRKPRQVAEMLNRDGHRTVLGARWTPRLTHFLLGLMFLPEQNQARPSGRPSSKPDASEPSSMTTESIAERLSRLGRVVISD